jgi:hypothetical protein
VPVRDITSLSPEFWEKVFGSGVVAGAPQRIGEGMIGANYRIALSASGSEIPASVVVKLPSPGEESRAAGVAHRTYEREAKFYTSPARSMCGVPVVIGWNSTKSRTTSFSSWKTSRRRSRATN